MKKLLCVLLFGLMFGQTELTTREFIYDVNLYFDQLDIREITNTNLEYYSVKIVPPREPWNNTSCTFRVNWGTSSSLTYKLSNQVISSYSGTFTEDINLNTEYDGILTFSMSSNSECEVTPIRFWVTAEFPEEDTGYIEEGFDYCLDVGANLVASPCRDALPILDTLPSEIANNLTGIIGQGVATTNQNGDWVGSLTGLGGGNGYWFQSNVNACFNYNCEEN